MKLANLSSFYKRLYLQLLFICSYIVFMQVFKESEQGFAKLFTALDRRAIANESVVDTVADVIAQVKAKGDAALIDYTARFDGVTLTADDLWVSEEEKQAALDSLSEQSKAAFAATLENIQIFAKHSLKQDWQTHNAQGAVIGERFYPYDRVGVYVPGGKAPLVSSALMTAGFAQAAGVKEIIAATPVQKDGKVNPALLAALVYCGVNKVLKVGGAQAIAALALGTDQVQPVEKIVGPGNVYVVEAKRQLVGAVSIDMLPGPSEILVLADDSANPAYIAADLLAQAEHGPDSDIVFITDSENLLESVQQAIKEQLKTLSRAEIIDKVLQTKTKVFLVEQLSSAVDLVNAYAPEHLSLAVANQDNYIGQIRTAGAIFVGDMSPVAVGDFVAGPSHTLPTGGAGKSFSGLRADQFQRRISVVQLDKESLSKSLEFVEEFARIEGLDAHGQSASIRLQ